MSNIQLPLYIRNILYYSRLSTDFVLNVSDCIIACSNKIVRVFVLR